MTYRIGKAWTFAAGHHIEGLPEGHKCSRAHGHTYAVEVTVEAAKVHEPGFVTDFGCLEPFGRYLAENLDHTDLSQLWAHSTGRQPTCENLAAWLYVVAGELELPPDVRVVSVRVCESPTTWAEYQP